MNNQAHSTALYSLLKEIELCKRTFTDNARDLLDQIDLITTTQTQMGTARIQAAEDKPVMTATNA